MKKGLDGEGERGSGLEGDARTRASDGYMYRQAHAAHIVGVVFVVVKDETDMSLGTTRDKDPEGKWNIDRQKES